jgi:signal transduction histidine kinase
MGNSITASAPAQKALPSNLQASGRRSVLDQLLHALNQPLTGLQCSMEVALAIPRTAEQYIRTLRDGLELTGRMRALAGAIREVVDEDEHPGQLALDVFDLTTLLQELLADLAPVAEAKKVALAFDGGKDRGCEVRVNRAGLSSTMFRLLESAISLADPGTVLGIQAGGGKNAARLRVEWRAAQAADVVSLPELGLLIAQARFERIGAQWERDRDGTLDRIIIHLRDAMAFGKS